MNLSFLIAASNIWTEFADVLSKFLTKTGFVQFVTTDGGWKDLIMIFVSFFLLYLAIKKQFEPLLLVPIAFGILLANLPLGGMFHTELFEGGHIDWSQFAAGNAGLLDLLYIGVKLGIYPPLIFMGVGAMTDFGPLIANPRSFLLGAAAQLGIFVAFVGAIFLALQVPRPLPSASSAAQTVRRPSS